MRLAVIADIHGNLPALEAVLRHVADQAPDAIVNLGDCVTGPLWPRATMDLLETLSIPTVRGNHDRWLEESPPAGVTRSIAFARAELSPAQRSGLASLPATLTVDDGILAVHGTPHSDTAYLLEEAWEGRLALAPAARLQQRLLGVSATLVLCGHSHLQHLAAVPGGPLVLNPGSVGCPRSADNPAEPAPEAGSPHARYAVATRGASGWRIELHALDYEWSHVAEQAIRRDRVDWALGFLGGSHGATP